MTPVAEWPAFEDDLAVAGELWCWASGHGVTLPNFVFVASALAGSVAFVVCKRLGGSCPPAV